MATVFGFHMCASESVRIQVMQKKILSNDGGYGDGALKLPPTKKIVSAQPSFSIPLD